MVKSAVADSRASGKRALAAYAWEEARACFEKAVAIEPSAATYEGLSWAAWWQSDSECLFSARERAYRLYREAGDATGAARMAMWIASDYLDFRGEAAVANGWRRRARDLLEGEPLSPEHGWLAIFEAEAAIVVENDPALSLQHAREATRIARELPHQDMGTVSLAMEGLALVSLGHVEVGLSQLDQAAASALGGELQEPFSTHATLCLMLYACERARDYDRAAQWCQKVKKYADARQITLTQGVCRAHYAGVLIWRGEWEEAETELSRAAEYLLASRPPAAAETVVRLAELRRRQGRTEEARALFTEVEWHPQALLGLAELALHDGRPRDAEDLLRRSLRHVPENARTQRADALALLARTLALLDERAGATESLEELRSLSDSIATDALKASTRFSAAMLAASGGDASEAARCLEDAVDLYRRGGAPYESAVARLELAVILAQAGRTERAAEEGSIARETFARLGAQVDLERAERFLRDSAADAGSRTVEAPLTPRQIDVLRLIALGMSDREVAEALVISEHTVHRHVANILQRLEMPSRAAAVAYAGRTGLL